jgi:hypothetical protein
MGSMTPPGWWGAAAEVPYRRRAKPVSDASRDFAGRAALDKRITARGKWPSSSPPDPAPEDCWLRGADRIVACIDSSRRRSTRSSPRGGSVHQNGSGLIQARRHHRRMDAERSRDNQPPTARWAPVSRLATLESRVRRLARRAERLGQEPPRLRIIREGRRQSDGVEERLVSSSARPGFRDGESSPNSATRSARTTCAHSTRWRGWTSSPGARPRPAVTTAPPGGGGP